MEEVSETAACSIFFALGVRDDCCLLWFGGLNCPAWTLKREKKTRHFLQQSAAQLLSHNKSDDQRGSWRVMKAFTAQLLMGAKSIKLRTILFFFFLVPSLAWAEQWRSDAGLMQGKKRKKEAEAAFARRSEHTCATDRRNVLLGLGLLLLLALPRTPNLPGRLLFTSGCCRQLNALREKLLF